MSEFSGWDFEKLDLELEALGELDMQEFGFVEGGADIDDLFNEQEQEQEQKSNGDGLTFTVKCKDEVEALELQEFLDARGVSYSSK